MYVRLMKKRQIMLHFKSLELVNANCKAKLITNKLQLHGNRDVEMYTGLSANESEA